MQYQYYISAPISLLNATGLDGIFNVVMNTRYHELSYTIENLGNEQFFLEWPAMNLSHKMGFRASAG